MIDTIVVSGGNIQEGFALDFLKRTEKLQGALPRLIAADKGLEFFIHSEMEPDLIIGDFDSLSPEGKEYLQTVEAAKVIRLKPEKDDSDTQSAVKYAVETGAGNIVLFGCLGTRLDHVLANMGLLVWGAQRGIRITICDRHNQICMVQDKMVLSKKDAFGKYVSFFPLGGEVKGLTLKGFKYPLQDYDLTTADSGLTVSNEIKEEKAEITFDSGNLVMIMSED